MADINIYGRLTCASGDRLTNAGEIRDDDMQAALGTGSSPTQAEINKYLSEKASGLPKVVLEPSSDEDKAANAKVYEALEEASPGTAVNIVIPSTASGLGLLYLVFCGAGTATQKDDDGKWQIRIEGVGADNGELGAFYAFALLASDGTCTLDSTNYSSFVLQKKLTSGENIKTINGVSLLGSGDITLDLSLYKVVTELPTEDIDGDKIYLVLSATEGESNKYTEYIYVNSAWEKIGEYKAEVDLTDYAKKDVATSTSDGLMSSTDKAKLDAIEAGAEKNVNAFQEIEVLKEDGTTDVIIASTPDDSFQLAGGTGITLEADDTDSLHKVTISANGDNLEAGDGITIEKDSSTGKTTISTTIKAVVLTSSAYEALETKDANTVYYITE